ncbi:MAG: class I SAM-dependent methyltransferase [Sphingomonas sp.]|nr:class I SAM-dependent methyltransferase [Sphingomonas sp.]
MTHLEQPKRAAGLTLHSPWWYDLTVWLFTLGRERAFRAGMLEPAHLRIGEAVLDVGCGTGSLAIMAKEQVGPSGEVYGSDASPEMIVRAQAKAHKAGADVRFAVAPAQALSFADSRFDVVLSTMMFHHLPHMSREQLGQEMRRVLKPGGRVLAVDFAMGRKRKGLVGRIHSSHGSTSPADIEAPLSVAGLKVIASAPIGMKDLYHVLAQAPGPAGAHGELTVQPRAEPEAGRGRKAPHALLLVAVGLIVVAAHLGAATWVAANIDRSARSLFLGGAMLAAIVLKLTVARRLRVRWHRNTGS